VERDGALQIAKIMGACILGFLLALHLQTAAMAAPESQCYQVVQTSAYFGRVAIFFDEQFLRMDLVGGRFSIYAHAPNWDAHVYNSSSKKRAFKTFSDFCKTDLEISTPWETKRTLEGKYESKTPIDFCGFRAVKLVCPDKIEIETNESKHGFAQSMKSTFEKINMHYAFLEGISMDRHIPLIVSAVYGISWKNKLPLAYFGSYDVGETYHWVLNTNSIKKVPSLKSRFVEPSDYQAVPMKQVTRPSMEEPF